MLKFETIAESVSAYSIDEIKSEIMKYDGFYNLLFSYVVVHEEVVGNTLYLKFKDNSVLQLTRARIH